jgi:hypothetical protein
LKKRACALFFYTRPGRSHVLRARKTGEAGSRKFSCDGKRIIRDDKIKKEKSPVRAIFLSSLEGQSRKTEPDLFSLRYRNKVSGIGKGVSS